MVFVDTGAWYALIVPDDPRHTAAAKWYRTNVYDLVTTDYVVDELVTLLMVRGQRRRITLVREAVFEGEFIAIEHVTVDDFRQAFAIHEKFADKEWSFTDCTSKVVMERLGIRTAFSFDKHFRQFQTVAVVPE